MLILCKEAVSTGGKVDESFYSLHRILQREHDPYDRGVSLGRGNVPRLWRRRRLSICVVHIHVHRIRGTGEELEHHLLRTERLEGIAEVGRHEQGSGRTVSEEATQESECTAGEIRRSQRVTDCMKQLLAQGRKTWHEEQAGVPS